MCFSATGSFAAAALNASAGAATIWNTKSASEAPLACFPLVFAAQQAIEGTLWLVLPQHAASGLCTVAAGTFATIALTIWPVLAPLAPLAIEPRTWQRIAMAALLVAGFIFAAVVASQMVSAPYTAAIVQHSIVYDNGFVFPQLMSALYVLIVCGPLLLSSQVSLRGLGILVLTGLVVSYFAFYYAFVSVWCFFAAIASGLIFTRSFFLARSGARLERA
jgi:hypothetical protein